MIEDFQRLRSARNDMNKKIKIKMLSKRMIEPTPTCVKAGIK